MRNFLAIFLVATAAMARTPGPVPDGMPFGRIGHADVDRLQAFALTRGFDFQAQMARVYSPDHKLDEAALGRVFVFSRQFTKLDQNSRTYGQVIYSSLLRIGEQIGVSAYAKIIDRQPLDVQQRVRDFLFYPVTRSAPKSRWEEALRESREIYPGPFPKGFQFAHDDPIFADEF